MLENVIIQAYLTTIISEVSVVYLFLHKKRKAHLILIVCFLANTFTHPLVIYFDHIQNISFLIVEIGAFVVEAIIYKYLLNLKWNEALMISLIANILSILIGIFIRAIIAFT